MKMLGLLLISFFCLHSQAIEPLITKKGKISFDRDFNDNKPLNPKIWKGVQEARWSVVDGVVFGQPSSEESRKKITAAQKAACSKKSGRSHICKYARLKFWKTPNETIIEMKIKFKGGNVSDNAYYRVIELGTHNARIQFRPDKTIMYANKNSETLDEKPWILAEDTYCTLLFEIKGKDFCIQIENGPTLRGSSDTFLTKARHGKLNLFGAKEGNVYIDHLKIWEAESK